MIPNNVVFVKQKVNKNQVQTKSIKEIEEIETSYGGLVELHNYKKG